MLRPTHVKTFKRSIQRYPNKVARHQVYLSLDPNTVDREAKVQRLEAKEGAIF